MKWVNVEAQVRFNFGYDYFHHLHPLQRKKIIRIIAEEYPEMHRLRIAAIVDKTLKEIKNPISYNEFLMQVHHSLR